LCGQGYEGFFQEGRLMARYRTVKPEFWTSEQVMECSPITRLMFIGVWNFADDAGRMPLSVKAIKAQVFPSDDVTSETIRGMIDELSSNGLIKIYSIDGKEYLQVTGWHHQKIDKPQKPKYPAPPPESENNSTNDRRTVAPERKKEGSREKEEDAAATRPALVSNPETDFYRRIKEIAGPSAGGLGKRLVEAKGGSIPLARAAVEQASTKSDPREYLGAIIRTREDDPQCRPDRSF
jgi:hypothetical protein